MTPNSTTASGSTASTPAAHGAAPVTRLLAMEDAPVLARLGVENREFLAPWEPARPAHYYTVETQREAVAALLEQHARGANLPLVILDENRDVIGRITINSIVRGASQSGTLGYWLSENVNGRGYASRAVAEVKRIAFTELGLHRLEAGTLVHNIRSQRVLERNGFQRYGLAPRSVKIAGRWQDHIVFQVLNE